jgi:hypothetical protein
MCEPKPPRLAELNRVAIKEGKTLMSIPPGQSPGSGGQQYRPPPKYSPPAVKRRWPRRHPVWSALIAIVVLLIIIDATASNKPTKVRNTATAAVSHSTATPTASRSPLECRAQATSKRPRDHTTVTIKIHTAAHTEVTVISRGASLKNKSVTGSSNASGNWTLRLRIGNATPGTRVVVTVRVSRHDSAGSCQASFRPRAAAVSAATDPATQPAVAEPATQPAASPSPAPVATQPAASPTTAASCYPLSDEGTCYEPGEYCRDDDHGMSGVAGDGKSIVCEDNDGWRWEPA